MDSSFEEAVGYKSRARALGEGYLNFSIKEAGELVCLLDIHGESISLCMIYHDKIIATGFFNFAPLDMNNSKSLNSFVTDLKTTLNYHTASLFDLGITVPLAAIIVGGENIDLKFVSKLQEHMKTSISLSRLNKSYLTEELSGKFDSIDSIGSSSSSGESCPGRLGNCPKPITGIIGNCSIIVAVAPTIIDNIAGSGASSSKVSAIRTA